MTNAMNSTNAGPLTLLQAADVARWYDEFTPQLRRFICHYLLRDAEDMSDLDDITQDIFLRIMRHMTRFASLSHAHRVNYAYHTARWVTADHYRRSQSRRLEAVPLSAVASSPMEPLTASHHWQACMQPEQTTATRMSLQAAWDATPHESRELLTLLAAGYPSAEIGQRLGISQHGVEMRVWRLRQMLRTAGEALS